VTPIPAKAIEVAAQHRYESETGKSWHHEKEAFKDNWRQDAQDDLLAACNPALGMEGLIPVREEKP
jgi:hypothetical protein